VAFDFGVREFVCGFRRRRWLSALLPFFEGGRASSWSFVYLAVRNLFALMSLLARSPSITAKPSRCLAWNVPASPGSDGTYRVGPDIEPGTYRSLGTSDSCYWERLRGLGGTLADIIANFIGPNPTIVAIAPTDAGFQSDRCGNWTKIG
jgi:hypothetical protein